MDLSKFTKENIKFVDYEPSSITKKYDSILKKFYNEIKQSKDKVDKTCFFNLDNGLILEKANLNSSIWLPPQIKDHIDITDYYLFKYSKKVDNKFNIDIKIYLEEEELINLDNIRNYIKLIIIWFAFIVNYSNKECYRTISIILYLTMNKNNLFKNHISNINNKYDNILNIILNNSSKVSNNIQNNTIHSNIFYNDENKTLKNIQNNDINNDIYNMTTENFSLPGSLGDITKIAESAVKNKVKQSITGIEDVLSTGLAQVGSEVVRDVIPNQYISEMLELTEQEKQLLAKYQNSPIKDKKYRIAIDVNSECDDPSLNYLTERNGASLYYNLIESCRGNDNEMLINTPVCKDECPDIDTVYGSINNDINELKRLKTKLEDMLEGKKVALARILNLINSQTEGEKEKYLGEITSLKSEISNLENTIKQIYSEESELKNTNSTLQNKINTQNRQINTLQSNNSNLQTSYDSLSKDYNMLISNYQRNAPGYETYDKVLSIGNYTPDENSLYIQGVTDEGGCVDNLPIDTAMAICDNYATYCDGFYTYGYSPGQKDSLRTCFKKNIDRNAEVVKNSETINNTYPNNLTYLKNIPNAPAQKCTGNTKSGYYTGMPCNYAYNQVSQKSGKTAADTWCSGSWNEGCTLQQN